VVAVLVSAFLCQVVVEAKDLYKILGVRRSASESQLKSAYRKLAMKVRALAAIPSCAGCGWLAACVLQSTPTPPATCSLTM
jgi:hypothetical protein